MSQSLSRNIVHLVFSTKNREPLLRADVRPDLHRYLGGILRQLESPAIVMNSVDDPIHILFVLSKSHALKKVVEEVKKGSSKWIKTKGEAFAAFYWQAGYGAFSVSQSNVATQENHHRTMGFQGELRAFLQKHQIEFDEKFLWK